MIKKITPVNMLIASIGLLLVLQFFSILFINLNTDIIEALHAAWLFKQGLIPYRDFFEHHHSFYYYFYSLFFIKQTVILMRILQLLVHFSSIYLAYKIAKIVGLKFKELILYIFLLLSTQAFIWTSIQVRPDSIMLLFSLLSIYLYFLFTKSYKNNNYQAHLLIFLSGVAGALSFLFLQKSIFVLFSLGLLIVYDILMKPSLCQDYKASITTRQENHYGKSVGNLICSLVPTKSESHCVALIKKYKFKPLFLFALGVILTLIPYYLHLYSLNILSEYWLWAYKLNLEWKSNSKIIFLKDKFISVFIRNIFIWVLIGITLIISYSKVIKRIFKRMSLTNKDRLLNENKFKIIFLFTIQLAACLFIFNQPSIQYFVIFLPLVLIMGAVYLLRLKSFYIMIFCLGILVVSVPNHLKWIVYRGVGYKIRNYILQNTSLADKVLIMNNTQYHPLFRQDIDYCWFQQSKCLEYLGIKPKVQDAYWTRQIELNKPAAVYLDAQNYPLTNKLLQQNYKLTNYNNLWLIKTAVK